MLKYIAEAFGMYDATCDILTFQKVSSTVEIIAIMQDSKENKTYCSTEQ